MYYVLVLLLLSTQVLAQPVEGPWVVEQAAMPASFYTPIVTLSPDGTTHIFCTLSADFGQWVQRFQVQLPNFAIVDTQWIETDDTLTYRLTDALMYSDTTWVVSVFATLQQYCSVRRIVNNSSGLDIAILEWGWFPIFGHGYWVLAPHLTLLPPTGFIIHWLRGNNDNPWGEPNQSGEVRYVPDVASPSVFSSHTLMGEFLYGPSRMAIEHAHDDSVVVILSQSPDYPGWGDPTVGMLAPDEEQMAGTTVPMICADQPVKIAKSEASHWFAVVDSSAPQIISFDLSGNCAVVADLADGPALSAVAWNMRYGFALLHVNASSIQLTRTDTTATVIYPTGVFFWHDPSWTIGEASVAINDSGLVLVAWTERNVDQARLMLGSVGWDTPLAATPQPEVASPRDFSLSAYPNPFNATVTITFDLPQRAEIELAIYNLLGEKVAVLTQGIEEPGVHSARWQPQVSSGIYFARLTPLDPLAKQGEMSRGSAAMQKVVYLK